MNYVELQIVTKNVSLIVQYDAVHNKFYLHAKVLCSL